MRVLAHWVAVIVRECIPDFIRGPTINAAGMLTNPRGAGGERPVIHIAACGGHVSRGPTYKHFATKLRSFAGRAKTLLGGASRGDGIFYRLAGPGCSAPFLLPLQVTHPLARTVNFLMRTRTEYRKLLAALGTTGASTVRWLFTKHIVFCICRRVRLLSLLAPTLWASRYRMRNMHLHKGRMLTFTPVADPDAGSIQKEFS